MAIEPKTNGFRDGRTASKEQFVVEGPTPDREAVQAWAGDYVRFDRRPPWQQHLRSDLREHCRKLKPAAQQVLHASFLGTKLPNADVENLTIYNIGSFTDAGVNGIRFELGDTVPPAPDGAQYPFGYRYALAPRWDSFTYWEEGRQLARFDWIDLGKFTGEKKLAQVWRAVARGEVQVDKAIQPEAPFAVRLEVRPPKGHAPVWGGLVKGIFDGVICALQAHTGLPLPPEALERLASDLGKQSEAIEKLLIEPRWDVLGKVEKLVSPYRRGVKWNPSDHLCVAGELLAAESVVGDSSWTIRGHVSEVHPYR